MTKNVSNIAASETIKVIDGQMFSYKKNITGEKKGVNPGPTGCPVSRMTGPLPQCTSL